MWSFTLLMKNQNEECTKVDSKCAFQCQMSWNGWVSERAYSTDGSHLETYVTRITSYLIIILTHLEMGTGYLTRMAEFSLCLARLSSAATAV